MDSAATLSLFPPPAGATVCAPWQLHRHKEPDQNTKHLAGLAQLHLLNVQMRWSLGPLGFLKISSSPLILSLSEIESACYCPLQVTGWKSRRRGREVLMPCINPNPNPNPNLTLTLTPSLSLTLLRGRVMLPVLWVKLCPPKWSVQVLTLVPMHVTLFGKRVL